jgi:hypothetical protein
LLLERSVHAVERIRLLESLRLAHGQVERALRALQRRVARGRVIALFQRRVGTHHRRTHARRVLVRIVDENGLTRHVPQILRIAVGDLQRPDADHAAQQNHRREYHKQNKKAGPYRNVAHAERCQHAPAKSGVNSFNGNIGERFRTFGKYRRFR